MSKPAVKPHANEQEALLVLLRSIADEIYALVCDMVRLGESLSAEENPDTASRLRDLQSFDLLTQSALSQARLLQALECSLSKKCDDGIETVAKLIEEVPFHKVRQRLSAAFHENKASPAEPHWVEGGGLDWF